MKNTAALLIFIFTLQISLPAFAQQSDPGQLIEPVSKCYEQLFTKFSSTLSKEKGKEIVYTAEKRLQFLHNVAKVLAYKEVEKIQNENKIAKAETAKTNYVPAGIAIGLVILGLGGKLFLDSKKLGVSFFGTVGIVGGSLWLAYWIMKGGWISLTNTVPASFMDLTKTKTEHDFFSQMIPANMTSPNNTGDFLIYCQTMLKSDFDPAMDEINNLTPDQMNQLSIFINQSK